MYTMRFSTHNISLSFIWFYLVLAAALFLFNIYTLALELLDGAALLSRDTLGSWINLLLALTFFVQAYFLRRNRKAFAELRDNGIEYRNPGMKTTEFIPAKDVDSVRLNGTQLEVSTAEKMHFITLGLLKFNEIEEVKALLGRYGEQEG